MRRQRSIVDSDSGIESINRWRSAPTTSREWNRYGAGCTRSSARKAASRSAIACVRESVAPEGLLGLRTAANGSRMTRLQAPDDATTSRQARTAIGVRRTRLTVRGAYSNRLEIPEGFRQDVASAEA